MFEEYRESDYADIKKHDRIDYWFTLSQKAKIAFLYDKVFHLDVNDDIKDFLRELSFSEFRQSENRGIGRHLQFANNYGTGATLLDGNNLVHLVYFNQIKFSKVNKRGQTRRYGSFRDFAENFD